MIVLERPRNLGWQNVRKELLRKTIIIAPSSSPMIEFNILYYIVCLFLCPLDPLLHLHLKVYGIVMTSIAVEHGDILGYHITLCYWSCMDRQQMTDSNACTFIIFTIIHYKICRKCWGPCFHYSEQGTGNVCRQFIFSLCNLGLSLDFIKIYVQQWKSI